MAEVSFKIHGLDCVEEVAILRRVLGTISGVHDLRFDLLHSRLNVTYDEALLDPSDMVGLIANTGMRAQEWQSGHHLAHSEKGWARWGRSLTTIGSGMLLLAGFGIHALSSGVFAALGGDTDAAVPFLSRGAYLGAAVIGAWFVLPRAWRAIRSLRPDMNLLMTVAIVGALGIGEWHEAATVSFLFSLSLALEAWSVGRARRAISALLALSPSTARVIDADQSERLVSPEEVAVGSTIIVKPGERIPLDGRVVSGTSLVDQAAITGESLPVAKETGAEVFAGTVNGDGVLEVMTTKPASDTTIARIVRMVGRAQHLKSRSEQWVEAFARYYTPTVMLLAIGVMVVPPLLLGGNWQVWFYQSLVLLVIACPCALVLSTPISIVASIASAARHGVLIKGGVFAELPARLRAIAFDKTGTLTQGQPVVQRIVPVNGHNETELLERAAAMESRATHPIGRAIMQYALDRNVRIAPAEELQTVSGKGATATINGRTFWVGSHRYLQDRGQETPQASVLLRELAAPGSTVVVVGNDKHICGFVSLRDALRPETTDTIASLKSAGIRHIMMLTGDNRETAAAISTETGIDEFRAELLPEDKVAAIESLVAQYGDVAMVGDGVNDAPAMARSSLGIAMGAVGSDAAIEAADIALMSDDLAKVAWLIHHSKRTVRMIRQNVVASLVVKTLFVGMTFAGLASLWAAIAADMGVSLAVVLNALRLLDSPDHYQPAARAEPL